MTQDVSHKQEPQPGQPTPRDDGSLDVAHLDAAVSHVDDLVRSGGIASAAAKGLLYSLIETLGALVGDPDLPEHARSGYEGLLETARELRLKIEH